MNTIIPLQAEAEALLWAGQLVSSHKLGKVILESDCKLVVDACISWNIQSTMLEVSSLLAVYPLWSIKYLNGLGGVLIGPPMSLPDGPCLLILGVLLIFVMDLSPLFLFVLKILS